jgi:hypothetical protein
MTSWVAPLRPTGLLVAHHQWAFPVPTLARLSSSPLSLRDASRYTHNPISFCDLFYRSHRLPSWKRIGGLPSQQPPDWKNMSGPCSAFSRPISATADSVALTPGAGSAPFQPS